jgi:hypothetical protein
LRKVQEKFVAIVELIQLNAYHLAGVVHADDQIAAFSIT